MERKRREEPKKIRGCHSSIALHPHNFITDDSGQVLGLAPNRLGIQLPKRLRRINYKSPFARASETDRKARPATDGIRTSTKYTTKVTDGARKVNLREYPKHAYVVSVFWGLPWIDADG